MWLKLTDLHRAVTSTPSETSGNWTLAVSKFADRRSTSLMLLWLSRTNACSQVPSSVGRLKNSKVETDWQIMNCSGFKCLTIHGRSTRFLETVFFFFFLRYAGCILKVLPTLYNSDESNFSVLRGWSEDSSDLICRQKFLWCILPQNLRK